VAATASSIVIAGGVTAANLPHLFKNSRRAAWSSGSTGVIDLSLIFFLPTMLPINIVVAAYTDATYLKE
jgi:hypothetical protein